MSTRWYPLYQKGNPQLRVYLPNFWMKLTKPLGCNLKPNQAQFIVSMEMSVYDVKNYLEKIYKVPVVNVKTYIQQGRFKRVPRKGYVVKEDDYRVAFVTMPKDVNWEFPDIFPKDKIDKEIENEKKNLDSLRENYKKYLEKNRPRPEVPGWFL